MKNTIRYYATAAGIAMLAAGAVAAAQSVPQSAPQAAPYIITESGRGFGRLQDAVNAIGGGTGTIRISAGRHADCAVQVAGNVTYLGAVPGQSVLEGEACEDKAALVLRGNSATVQGLVFANQHSSSGNGAGIRAERGDVHVSQSWFRDSQQGILSSDYPAGTITIDKSTFTRLGTCAYSAGCAHSIYVGNYGALTVTRTRFEQGRGGHYLKSRAARIGVFASSFDDAAGSWTNYMIDLPAGATGRIAGNWFVQGKDQKQNHSAFIAVAAEGRLHSSAGLMIEANDARFAPGIDWDSAFVADWSGEPLAIGRNVLAAGLARYERR